MTGPSYRAVVIPVRDRHQMLHDAVASIIDQVDRVVIVDNNSEPPIHPENWGQAEWWSKIHLILNDEDPPNISHLWNLGLDLVHDEASALGQDEWDVAVLNSDVVVPAGWMAALSTAMRSTPAVLAYPDQFGGKRQILHTQAGPIDTRKRITGYAYLLRGEADLHLDESMAWWYSDDDLDWTARERGGALLVPGLSVVHRDPNGSTNARRALQVQAARDRETFRHKWGRTPH